VELFYHKSDLYMLNQGMFLFCNIFVSYLLRF